ncbi:MAG: hypothetical protein AB1Z19_08925 [Eubacteriales bacterium]
MNFEFTFNILYILTTLYAMALLFMGFNWIKILSLIFGMFMGYAAIARSLPLSGFAFTVVASCVGVGFGFILFKYRNLMPLMISVGFVFFITGLIQTAQHTIHPLYMQVIYLAVGLAIGSSVFIARDFFLVIWTSILGAFLFVISLGFLSFGDDSPIIFASGSGLNQRILDIFGQNTLYHVVMFIMVLCMGLIVQFVWTAKFQLFVKRKYKGRH